MPDFIYYRIQRHEKLDRSYVRIPAGTDDHEWRQMRREHSLHAMLVMRNGRLDSAYSRVNTGLLRKVPETQKARVEALWNAAESTSAAPGQSAGVLQDSVVVIIGPDSSIAAQSPS